MSRELSVLHESCMNVWKVLLSNLLFAVQYGVRVEPFLMSNSQLPPDVQGVFNAFIEDSETNPRVLDKRRYVCEKQHVNYAFE